MRLSSLALLLSSVLVLQHAGASVIGHQGDPASPTVGKRSSQNRHAAARRFCNAKHKIKLNSRRSTESPLQPLEAYEIFCWLQDADEKAACFFVTVAHLLSTTPQALADRIGIPLPRRGEVGISKDTMFYALELLGVRFRIVALQGTLEQQRPGPMQNIRCTGRGLRWRHSHPPPAVMGVGFFNRNRDGGHVVIVRNAGNPLRIRYLDFQDDPRGTDMTVEAENSCHAFYFYLDLEASSGDLMDELRPSIDAMMATPSLVPALPTSLFPPALPLPSDTADRFLEEDAVEFINSLNDFWEPWSDDDSTRSGQSSDGDSDTSMEGPPTRERTSTLARLRYHQQQQQGTTTEGHSEGAATQLQAPTRHDPDAPGPSRIDAADPETQLQAPSPHVAGHPGPSRIDPAEVDVAVDGIFHLSVEEECARRLASNTVSFVIPDSNAARGGSRLGASSMRKRAETVGDTTKDSCSKLKHGVETLQTCRKSPEIGITLSNDWFAGTYDYIYGAIRGPAGNFTTELAPQPSAGYENSIAESVQSAFGLETMDIRSINTFDLISQGLKYTFIRNDQWKVKDIVLRANCDTPGLTVQYDKLRALDAWYQHPAAKRGREGGVQPYDPGVVATFNIRSSEWYTTSCVMIKELRFTFKTARGLFSGSYDQVSLTFGSGMQTIFLVKEFYGGDKKSDTVDLRAMFGTATVDLRHIQQMLLQDTYYYKTDTDKWMFAGIELEATCAYGSSKMYMSKFRTVHKWLANRRSEKETETVWTGGFTYEDWKSEPPKDEIWDALSLLGG
ncbi:hypothetical protein RJ55_01211 [Drechmeria coniospora]|nr:hypothetical protein RJ55_01211 [Drechmeria coniospora]